MSECRHEWADVTRDVRNQRVFLCGKCKLQKLVGRYGDLVIEAERQLGNPALSWTTDKPTMPGWYWWREVDSKDGFIVQVDIEGETVSSSGTADDASLDEMVGGEWAGPLEPPA